MAPTDASSVARSSTVVETVELLVVPERVDVQVVDQDSAQGVTECARAQENTLELRVSSAGRGSPGDSGDLVATVPGPPSPSLVTRGHNSVKPEHCADSRWLVASCVHGSERWLSLACKRRECPVCGPRGRRKIAARIAYGIRELWPAAWLVLTFGPEDVDGKSTSYTRERVARFMRWIRSQNPGVEYAATYERTKLGTLHINILAAPWRSIDQALLQKRWGNIVWVSWVRDSGSGVASEVSKTYSPESLGSYVAKLDQIVVEGRRVSFSRKWPRPPEEERVEGITWRVPEKGEVAEFEGERWLGWYVESRPGLYRHILEDVSRCTCWKEVLGLGSDPPWWESDHASDSRGSVSWELEPGLRGAHA